MGGTNPYSNPYSTSHRKEIDLRQEMHNTLYGAVDEIAKGRQGLLRRIRRDSNNNKIRCACRDYVTNEPSRDRYCRFCLGLGFYWDEVPITYFRNDKAYRKDEEKTKEYISNIFYTEYDANITDDDYIVEISLDSDGSVIIPIRRNKIFKVLSVYEERSDSGRVEFLEVRTVEERNWSTWYGVQNLY